MGVRHPAHSRCLMDESCYSYYKCQAVRRGWVHYVVRLSVPNEDWEGGIEPWGDVVLLAPCIVHLLLGTQVIISNLILFYFSTCSVFWDLYCAAPERRDTCEHSSEAKAFHDYVSNKFLILAIIAGLDNLNFISTKSKYTASWQWSLFSPCLSFCPAHLPAALAPYSPPAAV